MNYLANHWTEQLLAQRARARFAGYIERLEDEEYEAAANGNENRAKYLRYLQAEAPRMYAEAGARVARWKASA